jgi:hypothetical protein
MRGAQNVKDVEVEASGKPGKIVSFWVTENNMIYVKIKDHKGHTTNYRLTELPDDIKVVSLCEA